MGFDVTVVVPPWGGRGKWASLLVKRSQLLSDHAGKPNLSFNTYKRN